MAVATPFASGDDGGLGRAEEASRGRVEAAQVDEAGDSVEQR